MSTTRDVVGWVSHVTRSLKLNIWEAVKKQENRGQALTVDHDHIPWSMDDLRGGTPSGLFVVCTPWSCF